MTDGKQHQVSSLTCNSLSSLADPSNQPAAAATSSKTRTKFWKVYSPLKMQFASKIVLAFAVIGNAMFAVALPSPVAQVLPSTGNPSPAQDSTSGTLIVDVE